MAMISKDNAEHYQWGDSCDGWHLLNRPELSVIQERMPPRAAEIRHHHTRARQFFFILSGTAAIEVDDRVIVLRARQGIEIPPGTAHQMRNESAEELEFLVISQPHSHGDRQID